PAARSRITAARPVGVDHGLAHAAQATVTRQPALILGEKPDGPLPSRFMTIGGNPTVRGGIIVALGGDDEIRDFIGPYTRVVDLRGRLAVPAFGDAHVHPVQGGLESLRCDLTGLKSRPEYLAAIAAYSERLPVNAWVLGGGWSMPAFP